ncbi:hypothetical protein H1C71_011909, partial [Ictidomys tridecemlineatus]
RALGLQEHSTASCPQPSFLLATRFLFSQEKAAARVLKSSLKCLPSVRTSWGLDSTCRLSTDKERTWFLSPLELTLGEGPRAHFLTPACPRGDCPRPWSRGEVLWGRCAGSKASAVPGPCSATGGHQGTGVHRVQNPLVLDVLPSQVDWPPSHGSAPPTWQCLRGDPLWEAKHHGSKASPKVRR